MTTRRMFVMAGGAVVPPFLLVLLLGNQWVIESMAKHGVTYEGGGRLLYWLQFPRWRLTAGHTNWKYVFAADFCTLLMLVLIAVLALAGARTIDPRRGAFGAVVTGWWATVVAGGVSGLVLGPLQSWALQLSGEMRSEAIWRMLGDGATYGALYGWLAGLGALVAFFVTRPREYAAQQQPGAPMQPYAQQPYAQQPYGAQQGVQQPWGMQPQAAPQSMPQPGVPQPGMPQPGVPQQVPPRQALPTANDRPALPPQHPAAVPYVPPARPSQSPEWGGVPVQQQPAAPAPATTVEPVPAAEPDASGPQDAKEPPEPDPAPAAPVKDGADDDDEDDDLADRTMVDRKPDVPGDAGPLPPPM